MADITCGFIGLGLIGGSIARALKNASDSSDTKIQIYAYDINETSLNQAKKDGVVDEIFTEITSAFSVCDYIFLCAPVSHNDANLMTLKPFLSPDCILTDVGSVKTDIHKHITALGLDTQFIGGHPMAGSERIGYINSKARLLENAYYILTPTALVPEEKVTQFTSLVTMMGAIPLRLSYTEHDYITAAISHLPHIIASSLVNLVRDSDSKDGIMKMVAAGGFKDITRIASSSPEMWQQICLTNTANISSLLDNYISALQEIKHKLDDKNEHDLYTFFEGAQTYRDSFIEASSGPIKKSYALHLDIPDEAGALAAISTILALNAINIKNIGIVHNREFEVGVLRIEFYDESSVKSALKLLSDKGYSPHERK